ncbi:type II toxin-antitoxin system VapC family toxin [Curtobacterium flaccumfaciens pv. betae]|uniref:type II toxin-antitoxin system VapC family toxin n=1 Tax=Curtobacterium flaccumfaciens TaxID=2035 RepID=UPI002658F1A9|nr:type II toxin-antitoxin system VapC family toxin [Curtobacterium flaccumfaciens]MCS5511312.1 type II toxin-antitoxin system VapC family toxin [Curtobacterium flaccumfaciens pv. betae]
MFERLRSGEFDEHRVLEFDGCTSRPDVVLVETSFIECVLHRAEPQHVGASAFWDHLDLADTRILYSAYTEFELFESARHKGLQAARRHVAAWRDLLRSTQLHWVGIDDVSDGVPGLIEEFGLTASGAVHVATAISSKVDGFVTVDPAFGVVDKERLPLIIDAKGAQLARRLRASSRQ